MNLLEDILVTKDEQFKTILNFFPNNESKEEILWAINKLGVEAVSIISTGFEEDYTVVSFKYCERILTLRAKIKSAFTITIG